MASDLSRDFMARITLTGPEIQASREQQSAFVRAVQDEWAAIARGLQRRQEETYFLNKSFIEGIWEHYHVDPDLEMDIGL